MNYESSYCRHQGAEFEQLETGVIIPREFFAFRRRKTTETDCRKQGTFCKVAPNSRNSGT